MIIGFKKKISQRRARRIALSLVALFLAEIISPSVALALSGGPSQPEFSGFTQASATDMVDLFTGDFQYNLPLFDIDGYPVNLSYRSGQGMEEEASWVGLGWTLNPGMVSRSVRGIPDDFNGETITEVFHAKDQYAFSIGQGAAGEIAGLELGAGQALNFHSESGFSVGLDASVGVGFGPVNTGISASSSASSGITFTPYISSSGALQIDRLAISSVGLSASYNSRSGLQNISVSASASVRSEKLGENIGGPMSASFPINQTTYFPSQAPRTKSNSFSLDAKLGGGFYAADGSQVIKSSCQTTKSDTGPLVVPAYGYIYHENAPEEGMTDFNREGDNGHFTSEMDFLPAAALMPDVYSVTGQGISGAIRPYRMETGAFSDPAEEYRTSSSQSVGGEVNPGSVFDGGADLNDFTSDLYKRPWDEIHATYRSYEQDSNYMGQPVNSLEQNLLFYKIGELRPVNDFYFRGTGNSGADYGEFDLKQFALASHNSLQSSYTNLLPERHSFPASDPHQRLTRSEHMQVKTAKEAEEVGFLQQVEEYAMVNSYEILSSANKIAASALTATSQSYTASSGLNMEEHAIAEIESYGTDGSRYVFGIPALNRSFAQHTFSVNPSNANDQGLVTFTGQENSIGTTSGDEFFHSKTYDAPYAHSYLLTAYLGADYVDVTRDGITEDDLGTAVKFNWSRLYHDFKWRLPMTPNNMADYSQGLLLDDTDDKGSYTFGTKDIWYAHSIESKNHIAFFVLGNRKDGLGALSESGGFDDSKPLKKLEEIRIYTRDEWQRYQDHPSTEPVAVKTIEFIYDYSQCPGVVNYSTNIPGSDDNLKENPNLGGKLTLREVIIKDGNSKKGVLSPYKFDYQSHTLDADVNPGYHRMKTDRWGLYKGQNPEDASTAELREEDYTYVNEITASKEQRDLWASAWCLKTVTLPSGATIDVTYESDTYAKVQDKKAQMMFQVVGFGDENGTYSDKLHTGSRATSLDRMYMYVENPFKDDVDVDDPEAFFDIQDPDSWLYFRCKVKLPGFDGGSWDSDNELEDVRGYAKVASIDFHGPNNDWLKIRLKPVAFDDDGSLVHPVLKAAMDLSYTAYQSLLYGGINPNSSNLQNTIKNIVAIKDDLASMINGAYNHMLTKGMARTFEPYTSYVRLNHPKQKRYGGGHRVVKIEMNDNWTVSGAASTSYGQTYTYEDPVTHETYGVASYEPMNGNDENPFKKPHYYSTDDSNAKRPKPLSYQEEPFGEILLPNAVVGYSKVIVEPLNFKESKSAGQYTVHEFYTANDFPFKLEVSDIQKLDKQSIGQFAALGYGKSESFATTSQGYLFLLNDMHGKPRSETTIYSETNYAEETLKRTEYIYQTHEDGSLDNVVQAVDRNGEITDVTLGLDVDLNVDSRYIEQKTESKTLQVNLKYFQAGPFPVFLPPVFPKVSTTALEYRTAVITKQVLQKGILKSINYTDGNLQTTLTNDLYDAETAQVLKTSQTTEFNGVNSSDQRIEHIHPAYYATGRMGHAYRNDGFVGDIGPRQDFMTADSYNSNVKGDLDNKALMASMIYRGFMDGMDYDCFPSPNPLYESMFGNFVPEGVFVEGDEVMVVRPDAEYGDRYHAAEVLTADELDQLLGLTPNNPTSNDLTNWTPPGSSGGNTTTTIGTQTTPLALCDGQQITNPIIEQVFARVVAASDTVFDYSMLPLYWQYPGDHWLTIADALEHTDALGFYAVWDPNLGSNQAYKEDYYHLVSQLLLDDEARDLLAYLHTPGQDAFLDQDGNSSLNEAIGIHALMYILHCNEMRSCLVEACDNSSIVQVLEGLFQVTTGNYPVHGLLASMMAANWETNRIITDSETSNVGSDLCDVGSNLLILQDFSYDLTTYKDLFESTHAYLNDVNNPNAPYSGSPIATSPTINNTAAQNYQPTVYSYTGASAQGPLVPCFGHFDENCQYVDYLYSYDLSVYSCQVDILSDAGDINDPGDDPEDPNDDPEPPTYNTPGIGELVVFIDENGAIANLKNKRVKIIRSGRRNMLTTQAGTESYIEAPFNSAPDDRQMLSAAATQYKDEWATDFDLDPTNTFNAFLTGHRGIFRAEKMYQPNGDRAYDANVNSAEDGLIDNYTPFWSYDEDGGNSIYDQLLANANAENQNWVNTETYTNYSGTGAALESVNALDIYSALVQARNNHMIAEGVNARHRDILVEDFEGYNEANGLVTAHGLSGATQSIVPTTDSLHVPWTGHSGSGCIALNGTVSSSTGNLVAYPQQITWAWDIDPESDCYSDDFYRIKGFAPGGDFGGRTFLVSFWAKSARYLYSDLVSYSTDFDPSATVVTANVIVKNGGAVLTNQAINSTGQMIDGWQRMQVEFNIPMGATNLELVLNGAEFGCMVDDLRVHPSDGKALTYVYDKTYRRLIGTMDENNLGSFFKYDQDGSLMKTERETENGRLTIKEQLRNTRVQP